MMKKTETGSQSLLKQVIILTQKMEWDEIVDISFPKSQSLLKQVIILTVHCSPHWNSELWRTSLNPF